METSIQVGDTSRYVTAYILHDAVANVEGYITDFDRATLQQAENEGMVILAEYNDGTRARVSASEVHAPKATLNGMPVVMPIYVDERIDAVIDVFDAMTEVMFPDMDAAALSSDDTPSLSVASVDENDPVDSLIKAIKYLKHVASPYEMEDTNAGN